MRVEYSVFTTVFTVFTFTVFTVFTYEGVRVYTVFIVFTYEGVLYLPVAYPEGKLPPPRNPGKFANDGEQPRPRPAIRIDSSRKL